MAINELLREILKHDQQMESMLLQKPDCDLVGDAGTILKKDNFSFIDQGVNAGVWKYEDSTENKKGAVKIFFDDCRDCALSYETYQRMRDLPLKNIVQAREIFKKNNQDTRKEEFDAYWRDLLSDDNQLTLLEMPTSRLLQNIENWQQDVLLLSEQKILLKDIHTSNSMFHQDDSMLYITDIDLFSCQEEIPQEIVLSRNYNSLLFLIREHLYDNMRRSEDFSDDAQFFHRPEIKYYFSSFKDSISSDPISYLPVARAEKIFGNYETPKEYFLKR